MNYENLIKSEVERISTKYNKDFLDCEDLIKITGLGRDNVRSLLRSKNFYVKEATDKLNEKIIENEKKREQVEEAQKEKEEQEKQSELSDEEFDRKVAEMLQEQEERKRRRRERDFEM